MKIILQRFFAKVFGSYAVVVDAVFYEFGKQSFRPGEPFARVVARIVNVKSFVKMTFSGFG